MWTLNETKKRINLSVKKMSSIQNPIIKLLNWCDSCDQKPAPLLTFYCLTDRDSSVQPLTVWPSLVSIFKTRCILYQTLALSFVTPKPAKLLNLSLSFPSMIHTDWKWYVWTESGERWTNELANSHHRFTSCHLSRQTALTMECTQKSQGNCMRPCS